ncbi:MULTISPECIES: amino acid ABC transporter permease [Campylobacter]|jgi:amino ABC transporter, permease protein, 3-TM region, his/glu/gln/arg/opine family|uniref:Glutamate/aspartate import permease protein GltK n=1 Tax=Campylobacter showae CSUNSWCD TaxID=1244083 RepID=M5IEI3_9BACT|nr:amino acid ABC transporter permease [Campylobacter showae]EKU10817.1 Amino acid ABC-type transporter, permease component [Campylobacter showae CSUNSWCD]
MNEFDRISELLLSSLQPMALAMIKVTLPLTAISFSLGLLIAVLTAIARIANIKILKQLSEFYIWIFRGTPLLVQLFIVYFGLPIVGITLDVWSAAIITFSLNIGAYASEAVRAAVLSVPKGQWEAATALGMSYAQILRRIIAPQAARISLPPLSNIFISTLKDTSLAASITMVDMFMVAQRIAARTFDPLTLYVLAALFYLIVCTFLTFLQARLEKRFSRYV